MSNPAFRAALDKYLAMLEADIVDGDIEELLATDLRGLARMEVRSAAPNGLGGVLMPGDPGESRWSGKDKVVVKGRSLLVGCAFSL